MEINFPFSTSPQNPSLMLPTPPTFTKMASMAFPVVQSPRNSTPIFSSNKEQTQNWNALKFVRGKKLLKDLSTWGIGGPCNYFVQVFHQTHLLSAIRYCREFSIPYVVIGKGSNCLFDDLGFDGCVLLNQIDFLERMEPGVYRAGSGFRFNHLGSLSCNEGFTGLEFAAGIPGTVGGATYMNAGANGQETANVIESVDIVTTEGNFRTLNRIDLTFGYRSSSFQDMDNLAAIVAATFRLERSGSAKKRQQELLKRRRATQPVNERSAGSVFRNPVNLGVSAAELIDKAGLKGCSIGGAMVSNIHANFLVNILGFHIFLDMLPEYIHMRVAESILFAGKAIRVLWNPSPAIQFQDALSNQQTKKGSQKFHGSAVGVPFQKEAFLDVKTIGEELLPQSVADKIETMLLDLKESSEFHKRSFECSVDSIRAIAASHLWQLVVVRADLNGHLKALKDYFLLAKGDFFQCFLEESRQLMRLPPRQSTAEADLMVPFQLAAIKTIGEEDKYFSRVSLLMPSFGITVKSSQRDLPKTKAYTDGSSETSVGGWDGIALEYSVDWPLQLFFTQEVLSKYRRIFQYLLRLKRTQMELEKSWASVMHQEHTYFAKHRKDQMNCSISQPPQQCFRPMWRVREHMAFLIRNLQFYIQVDVIESQWNVLQSHIQDSHDFTELVGFHQEYLSALISQSFLDIGSVSRILDSIMTLCLQFCWNIEHQESSQNTSELERITEEFNKKSNSLYTILRSSRLAGSQRAPFLRRFLLRMNFNSFFEATARGVLNVVRPRPSLPVLNQQ